jgi:PAS domain S-box-containing protein
MNNTNKPLNNIRLVGSPFIVIVMTTIISLGISIYCLSSGYFIIFQNLFYIPIIIACVYYTKKGFAFSVVLSFIYFFLIVSFTRDLAVIIEALIRVFIFAGVAGVTTFLSIKLMERQEELKQSNENLEHIVKEQTIELRKEIEKRKHNEEALSNSERKYRNIFEYATEGIFQSTPEGRYITVNPAFARIGGYSSPDEMIETVTDIQKKMYVHQEDRARLLELLNKHDIINNFEAEIRRRDNAIIWISMNVRAVRDQGGEIKFLEGTIGDITERKRAEEALIKSEMLNRRLVEHLPHRVFIKDLNSVYVTCNANYARDLGVSQEQIVGKDDFDFHSAELAEAYRTDDRVTMELGQMKEIEEQYIVADQERWVRTVKVPFLDEQGKIIGVLGVFEDITERKQAEQDLEKMMVLRQGVNTLQQSLLAPTALEEKLKEITDSIVRLFGADFCRIWLIQPGDLCEQGCVHADVKEGPHICRERNRCLHLVASSGRYTHIDGIVHRRVPFGCYKIGRVASEQDHKFLTNDVQNDPRVHNHEWARELGLVSFAGYQLRVPGGETMGVLALFAKYPIQAGEDAILDGLSSTTALIIKRDSAERSLHETLESLRNAFGTTIQVMVSAVESRDPYTAGHQLRVADLARAIATEMGLAQKRIEGIQMAGSIHDLGKLSVPAEILSKPTRLTNNEFSLIKEHSQKGYEILKDVESPWPLAQIVYQHHERMDGSGYPRNLKGDEILMEARIMAVADVVEAMASHRPYRPALGIEVALEEIEKNKGTFYDSVVADACLRLFREKGYQLSQA